MLIFKRDAEPLLPSSIDEAGAKSSTPCLPEGWRNVEASRLVFTRPRLAPSALNRSSMGCEQRPALLGANATASPMARRKRRRHALVCACVAAMTVGRMRCASFPYLSLDPPHSQESEKIGMLLDDVVGGCQPKCIGVFTRDSTNRASIPLVN